MPPHCSNCAAHPPDVDTTQPRSARIVAGSAAFPARERLKRTPLHEMKQITGVPVKESCRFWQAKCLPLVKLHDFCAQQQRVSTCLLDLPIQKMERSDPHELMYHRLT